MEWKVEQHASNFATKTQILLFATRIAAHTQHTLWRLMSKEHF
jgi:hypothetical protein